MAVKDRIPPAQGLGPDFDSIGTVALNPARIASIALPKALAPGDDQILRGGKRGELSFQVPFKVVAW
jgi:hypothetical protein